MVDFKTKPFVNNNFKLRDCLLRWAQYRWATESQYIDDINNLAALYRTLEDEDKYVYPCIVYRGQGLLNPLKLINGEEMLTERRHCCWTYSHKTALRFALYYSGEVHSRLAKAEDVLFDIAALSGLLSDSVREQHYDLQNLENEIVLRDNLIS